eukprot:953983-Alexandrium_andersonii.AAC.1
MHSIPSDGAGPVGIAPSPCSDGAAPGSSGDQATPVEAEAALHPDDAGVGGAASSPHPVGKVPGGA